MNDAPSFTGVGTGTVLTPVGAGESQDIGRSVTVQADGKIVVAGYGTGNGTGTDIAVVRYNTDGSLDTSFGTGGKILTPVGTGTSSDAGYSVTVQADGKIVVAGYGDGSGGTDFAVVRYNADGSLDTTTTFGAGGKILTPVGTGTSPTQLTLARASRSRLTARSSSRAKLSAAVPAPTSRWCATTRTAASTPPSARAARSSPRSATARRPTPATASRSRRTVRSSSRATVPAGPAKTSRWCATMPMAASTPASARAARSSLRSAPGRRQTSATASKFRRTERSSWRRLQFRRRD